MKFGIGQPPRRVEEARRVSAAGGVVETYRGGVAAWECDVFAHLNIAFYAERFADAALDRLERSAPTQRWRTIALDTRYTRELRAGEGIAIRSGILESSTATVRIAHEAVDGVSGARTTTAEHTLVPLGSAPGAPLAADRFAWDRFAPFDWPTGTGRIAAGRDRIRESETEAGSLSLLAYLHRFSNACLHVIEAIGMSYAYRREAERGFATFETRLVIDDPSAGAGEGVFATSGVVAVGRSSLAMLHRLHATSDRRPLARFYQAGVHFDLAARRSSPWPDGLRDQARGFLIAGP